MITMTATEAQDNLDKLWDMATHESVTIESDGKPIAVVLSPEEYENLTRLRQSRHPGTMKQMLANLDIDALLATPIDDVFAEYM